MRHCSSVCWRWCRRLPRSVPFSKACTPAKSTSHFVLLFGSPRSCRSFALASLILFVILIAVSCNHRLGMESCLASHMVWCVLLGSWQYCFSEYLQYFICHMISGIHPYSWVCNFRHQCSACSMPWIHMLSSTSSSCWIARVRSSGPLILFAMSLILVNRLLFSQCFWRCLRYCLVMQGFEMAGFRPCNHGWCISKDPSFGKVNPDASVVSSNGLQATKVPAGVS